MHIIAKIAKFYFTFVRIYKKYSGQMKKYLLPALVGIMSLSLECRLEAASALKTDPAVSSGVLDCGLSYYLVSNASKTGTADFALVRKLDAGAGEDLREEERFSRGCLDSLPHFADRKPMDFLMDHGISYPRSGYLSVDRDAVLYHFRDVDLSRGAKLTDSTLLMLFDIALKASAEDVRDTSAGGGAAICDQAVIISGDIDKESVLKKMDVLSMMIRPDRLRDSAGVSVSGEELPAVPDSLSMSVHVDSTGGTASVRAVFYGPAIPRSMRGTAVSLMSSRFWSEFRTAAQNRIASALRSAGVPYSSVSMFRYSSAEASRQEKYSIVVGTSPEDTAFVMSVVRSVLSDFRQCGLTPGEYSYAGRVASRDMYFRSVSSDMENGDYVRKCADAFVYGAAIVSPGEEARFFLTSGLPDTAGRRFLNRYLAALIPETDAERISDSLVVPDMKDTLLLAQEQTRMKVRKSRKSKNAGADIWNFPNGMTVIYKKMPTDGIMYYSWVLRGGFSSVTDLKPGEGAFYSDLFFKGNVYGIPLSDLKRILAAEGISMDAEVSLAGTRISGSAPFDRMSLLMKSLLSVSGNYSEDTTLGQYYLDCERLRLSSMRGEYRSRLAVIDSIMCPGYRYSRYKSLSALYPDLPPRAETFYKEQFSRGDDGALILVGDMDGYDVRRIMESYIGGFRTQGATARRPWVSYQPVSGWSTYLRDGRSNSLDVVYSARLILSSTAYMSAQIVTMAVKDVVSKALAEYGMTAHVSADYSSFPQERYTASVSVVPASLRSLPASVYRGSSFLCLYSVRRALSGLMDDGLREDEVAAYKAALLDSYKSRQDDPAFWTDIIGDRIITGKSLDMLYEEKIASVSAETVNEVLASLKDGSQVEYVIKHD